MPNFDSYAHESKYICLHILNDLYHISWFMSILAKILLERKI